MTSARSQIGGYLARNQYDLTREAQKAMTQGNERINAPLTNSSGAEVPPR